MAAAAAVRERLGPPGALLHLVGGYAGDTSIAAIAWLCSPEAGAVSGQRIPPVGRA